MAATGDEAASIAQAAKALDVDAQNSGATGDESVRLRQLKMLRDSLTDDITARLATVNGVSGDVNAQLDTLDGTKSAIKDAIIAKGVEVPEGTVFRDYATKIGEIESGASTLSILATGDTTTTLTSPAIALIGKNSSKYDIVNRGEAISDEYLLTLSPDGTRVTCRGDFDLWIALGAS